MWRCTQCGKDNEDKSRFCIYCGTRHAVEQPVPPAAPAEPPVQPEPPRQPVQQPVRQPEPPRQPMQPPVPPKAPVEEPRQRMEQPEPKKAAPKKKGGSVLKVLGGILALLLAAAIGVAATLLYRQHQEDEDYEPVETAPVEDTAQPEDGGETSEPTQAPEAEPQGDSIYSQLIRDGRDGQLLELTGSPDDAATIMVPSTWLDGRAYLCELTTWSDGASFVVSSAKTYSELVSVFIDGGNMVQELLNDGYHSVGVVYTGGGTAVPAYLKVGDGRSVSEEDLELVLNYFQRSIVSSFRWLEAPAAADGDYLLPDSATAYVTEGDLDALTHEELCFARNEIFARRGRIFTTPELRDYFESKDWYVGTIPGNQFDSNMFNDFERTNIKFITDYEDRYYGGSYY